MTNLLSLKFYQPAPPPKYIARPLLVQRLNEGLELGRPLTLVSAPAGFGKTTCTSEWLAGLDLPAAWLSLDADDNDPGRFFTYLTAVLRRVGEKFSSEAFPQIRELERVLAAGQLPPVEVIAAALIGDISDLRERQGRFLLVLDDFQAIQEQAILMVFEKLIGALFQANLPQPLHLVLLSREDPALPLARLRASNLLTEIRAEDLRFSIDETSRFLREVMDLGLAKADILALEERTEGWVVGLQLVGLSMRGRSDPSAFIRNLSGSHRFILSYLAEEVLSRQPEDIQQFLLETSILDRLNGDVCRAVTGRTDSHALLEQLCRANLFLIPLDDEQRDYRYHHLFAGLLRSRLNVLQTETAAELHRRASRWYARSHAGSSPGDRAAFAGEAVRHALAAQDYAAAVELIEDNAAEMLMQWYAQAVHAWMRGLPPEWSARSPRTNLAFARMHLNSGNFALAAPYLERLQALFSAPRAGESGAAQITPALTADWLALQSTLCAAQGQPVQALELAQQARAAAPQEDTQALSQVYLALALAYQQLDEPEHAREAYRRLIQLGRASANSTVELMGISALALMMINRGELRESFALASQGAERVERLGVLPPICAGIYGELGVIYSCWNQPDQAERYFQRAAHVSALGGSDAEVYFAVFRSRLALIRGDLDAAMREIQQAAEIMRASPAAVVREEVIAQQVQVALAQNDLAAAEQILVSFAGKDLLAGHLPDPGISYAQGVLDTSGLRVLLHRARVKDEPGRWPQVIEQADRLLETLRQRQFAPLVIETLLLRGQAHAARGSLQPCLDDFTAALDLAEPEGFISPFVVEGRPAAEVLAQLLQRSRPGSARVNYIQSLLDAFPDSIPLKPAETQPAALFEPLTARELEVLGLMAEGRTYEEIAGQLFVSINTVRTHVKAVYGKLGVNNRTAAIAAAQQAGIL